MAEENIIPIVRVVPKPKSVSYPEVLRQLADEIERGGSEHKNFVVCGLVEDGGMELWQLGPPMEMIYFLGVCEYMKITMLEGTAE